MKKSMNKKKFMLATLAGGITMCVVAGIWHNVIMANLYNKQHAEHEDIALLIIAYLILAMFMSYLYPLFHKVENRVLNGLLFGSIIGLLWVFPHDLAMAGAHNTSLFYAIKNGAWYMVEQGIGGIVIALILGKKNLIKSEEK